MRLSTFEHNDIEIKYVWQEKKPTAVTENNSPKLVVVLTNAMEKSGHTDFLFSLSKYSDINRLYVSAFGDSRFGLHLMKDGTFSLRDATVALIEKYRIEVGAEKRNTYLIGFCASSWSVVNICVNYGYSGIFTEFTWNKFLFSDIDDKISQENFIKKFKNEQESLMDFTLQDFAPNILRYTGKKGTSPLKFIFDDLLDIYNATPEKIKNTKFYWFAGKFEETYKFFGQYTISMLDKYGFDYELTVSEAEFDHKTATAFFIEYFTEKLKQLGVTEI
jgi:hypothetical protein